jgi:putative FmdB family regulatory protein
MTDFGCFCSLEKSMLRANISVTEVLLYFLRLSMPIYEYQCAECEHSEEFIQKISDAPLTVCPACGKPALKKKIAAAGFRLSGSGWYETDFKSGNKKNLTDSGGSKDS